MIFNKQKIHMDNTERRIYKREIERLVKVGTFLFECNLIGRGE